jgi:hypothetical protein
MMGADICTPKVDEGGAVIQPCGPHPAVFYTGNPRNYILGKIVAV